jgi:AAA ATPase domain
MKLSQAFARFYKSFNFDHVRKLDAKDHMPWDYFRGQCYPFVRVPIDARITTVVGANESGKSHLLGAIKSAITGRDMERRDLCRYSPYFGVAQGQRCWPHVGVGWTQLSLEEAEAIGAIAQVADTGFDRFVLIRESPDDTHLWIPGSEGAWTNAQLDAVAREALEALLPQPFLIKPEVALPNAIPFAYILNGAAAPRAEVSRSAARAILDAAPSLQSWLGNDPGHAQNHTGQIFSLLHPLLQPAEEALSANELASYELGRRLLVELGEIDPEGLEDLARAVDKSDEGYANGLLRSVNQQLERKLNFRRYWVQDRDFSLRTVLRHRELAFTISDRTGTEYTFSERSSGLRYFLSYLIQAQVHQPTSARESILLMDEPDTYLSAEAQQDLMRVFQDLAEPNSDRDPIQVIYVTHSPFLLDKNHGERIRVLEKGTISDGARVVPNVTRNHYEPLRSAFGAFVGENAFVGAVNLLVEGPADQIILAAAAAAIRKASPHIDEDSLDLNRIVIVPCGSAGEVPHTLFRIRGQGADKPPTVILLDSDASGLDAKKLLTTDKMLKRNISPALVLDLATIGGAVPDWPTTLELEDLVPPRLAHAAVGVFIDEVMKFREGAKPKITLAAITKAIAEGGPLLDAVNKVVKQTNGRIEKVGFAKAIAWLCAQPLEAELAADMVLFLERMRVLFRAINQARRVAERDAGTQRLETLVDQRARLFVMDNPHHATREQARIVLDDIEANLDLSVEADAIRNDILALRRDFALDGDPDYAVEPYAAFHAALAGLKHAHRRSLQAAAPVADAEAAVEPAVLAPAPAEGAGAPA